jgi:hypothetical protein
MSIDPQLRFVLAGTPPHALPGRTDGPALCSYTLGSGARWLLHGFTKNDISRIGCADCRHRAAAMIAPSCAPT